MEGFVEIIRVLDLISNELNMGNSDNEKLSQLLQSFEEQLRFFLLNNEKSFDLSANKLNIKSKIQNLFHIMHLVNDLCDKSFYYLQIF